MSAVLKSKLERCLGLIDQHNKVDSFPNLTCCLGCLLQPTVGFSAVMAILPFQHTVRDLAGLEEGTLGNLTMTQTQQVISICRSLLERSSTLLAYHQGFFHKTNSFLLTSPHANYDITPQPLGFGTILECFIPDQLYSFCDQMLENLTSQILDVRDNFNLWPMRYEAPLRSTIIVDTYRQVVLKSTPFANTQHWFDFGGNTLKDQLENLKRILITMERISLVIVSPLVAKMGSMPPMDEFPCAKIWIDFFKEVFGDLDGLIVAFKVQMGSFIELGVESCDEALEVLNGKLESKDKKKVKILTIPSIPPGLPIPGLKTTLDLKGLPLMG